TLTRPPPRPTLFPYTTLFRSFALELDWLPVQGYTQISEGLWPWFENLILPALALGCVYIALIARITRASMLEVLQQDFIRTARRSEEHTSELQSRENLVCRLL